MRSGYPMKNRSRMKLINSIITIWAAFLTVLAFINASTIGIGDLASGLLLMWITYLIFFYGTSKAKQELFQIEYRKYPEARLQLIVSVIFSAIAIPLVIRFYTGKTVLDVVNGIIGGGASYQEYQNYFKYMNLSEFSVAKVPIVLMNSIAKFLLIYWVIRTFVYRERKRLLEIALSFMLPFLYLLFSLARGTSYEMFELMCLLVLSIFLRKERYRLSFGRLRAVILILTIFFLGINYFQYSLNVRGPMECATAEICLDESTFLMRYLPGLGMITYKFTGYFLFGIFFSSVVIEQLILANSSNILAAIVPGGFLWNTKMHGGMRFLICGKLIDCGAAWIPDTMNILYVIGLIGLTALLYFVGLQCGKMSANAIDRSSVIDAVGLYFVMIFMISLPVGNLLSVSSSNILCIVFVIFLKLSKKAQRLLDRLMSSKIFIRT